MEHLRLLMGNANPQLGRDICAQLRMDPARALVGRFNDGEIQVQIMENIRGMDVFIVQSTHPPAENLMELLILIDAAKRASARRVTAVIPYFGYARQDRKEASRVPISAKLVANLIAAAGADRILTMDLHAAQIQGFFDIPVDHLYTNNEFYNFFTNHFKFDPADLVIVAPDVGSVKMVRSFAKKFDAPLVVIDKRRPDPNVSEVVHVIGQVEGKVALLRDDLIDTGGTIVGAAQAILDRGAKDVYICATHPLLAGAAIKNIAASNIRKLVVADTIPLAEEKRIDRIQQVSMAGLFAEAIIRIHNEQSLSALFD